MQKKAAYGLLFCCLRFTSDKPVGAWLARESIH